MKRYFKMLTAAVFAMVLCAGTTVWAAPMDSTKVAEKKDLAEVCISQEELDAVTFRLPYRELIPEEMVNYIAECWEAKFRPDQGKFQTKRLIVSGPVQAKHLEDAEVLKFEGLDQYVLQYDSEKAAKAAYKSLKAELGADHVFVDEILDMEEISQETNWWAYPKYEDDGTYTYSWGTNYMGMDQLKEYGVLPDQKVTVAVVDTGVDTGNYFFDGRKFSKDSYDFVANKAGYEGMVDEDGHGTNVAGIIADATGENVSIMALKINYGSATSTSMLVSAVAYAVDHGADVINASFMMGSADGITGPLDEALKKAKENNIIVVASSGNAGAEQIFYPAASPYTYAVGALNEDGVVAGFSNYGRQLDFNVPGSSIVTALSGGIDGETTSEAGTSMSTPEMAAAFAWMKMYYPEESNDQLFQRMKKLCIDLGDPGWDMYYGWGAPVLDSLMDCDGHHRHNYKYTSKKNGTHTRKCKICGYKQTRQCRTYKVVDGKPITCKYCKYAVQSTLKDGVLNIAYADATFLNFQGIIRACGYEDIQKIVVENGYTEIPDCAFEVCGAESITLPTSIEKIRRKAFTETFNLKELDLSKTKVKEIQDHAIYFSHITSLKLPKTLKKIYNNGISYCSHLKELDLSNTAVEEIGYMGVGSNDGLTSIKFPSTLKKMEYMALRDSCDLETIDLSKTSLERIEMHTFIYCNKLKMVVLPPTIKELEVSLFEQSPKFDTLVFTGDCPEISVDPMYGSGPYTESAFTAYYPMENPTWSDVAKHPENYQYGGDVTYVGIPSSHFLANCTVTLSSSKLTYNGNAQKPKVSVMDGDGRELVIDKDYTLRMASRKEVGETEITILGKGDYAGVIHSSYTVVPKKPAISKISAGKGNITVEMKNAVSKTGGKNYQIQYRVKGASSWTTKNTTAKSLTIKSLKKGKTYEVRVRAYKKVSGVTYYGSYTAVKASGKVK